MNQNNKDYYSYTKNMFKKIAPFYNIFELFIPGIRKKVVELTNVKTGKVLDVCCGTGTQAIEFSKNNYEVSGIDLSDGMLNVANRKNTKNKYGIKFIIGDAAAMPYEDNQFDISCISFALHDMPADIRKKILTEMTRVTKPKGNIMIIDYALPENKIKKFLIYHFIKLYETKYYEGFIKSDIKELIKNFGIEVKEDVPVMFGGARILKGINNK